MAVDIIAVWGTCKALIKQIVQYADSGYTNRKDNSGMTTIENKLGIENDEENAPQHRAVKVSDIPHDIKAALDSNMEKVLSFIDAYLLSNDNGAFYGNILISFESKIDYTINGPINSDPSTEPMLLEYNPLHMGDLTLNQLIGISINEIIKIIHLHPSAFAKANPLHDKKKHEDLEIGSSCSSSSLVMRDITIGSKESRINLPDNVYTRSDLELETGKRTNAQASLEYYYQVAQAYRKEKPRQNGDGDGDGNGSGDQNLKDPGCGGQSGKSGDVSTPNNGKGSQVHQWEDMQNPGDTDERIKQTVKQAFDQLNEKQRGLIPGSIMEQINALMRAPEINWKQLLRKYIGIIPYPSRPSRTRLNRRQPERADLSGRLPKRLVRVIVAIDTSGSMSNDDIEYVFGEIFNILADYKTEMTVIECDASIGRVYTAKKLQDIDTKVTGRGGTSFVPVIDYINNHKFADAVMIYFTDGYGDNSIPKPRTYKNLWVVLDDERNLSVEEPYGQVKALRKDKDYMSRKNGGF